MTSEQPAAPRLATGRLGPRHGASGAYVLDEAIGDGATSIVWRGRQVLDGTAVAIKTPKRRSAAAGEELRAEGRRLRRVASIDGVVPIVDVIDDQLGLGLVLGLAERGSLVRVLVEEGALGGESTLRMLATLASALEALHGRGIVHADLKPSNVLVRADGSAWIGDLGSAVEARAPRRRRLRAVGTPGSAAPEICAGEPPTPAADVFGWGIVGWCCLTGRPPGPLELPVRGRGPASRSTAAHERPSLPAELVELLRAATAPSPADRPRDGHELSMLLGALGPAAPAADPPGVAAPIEAQAGTAASRAWDVDTVEFGPRPGCASARRRRTSPVERVALAVGVSALSIGIALAVRAAADERTIRPCEGDHAGASVAPTC